MQAENTWEIEKNSEWMENAWKWEREREREYVWGSGGARGITARLSRLAVSPASLHQIESIFLVDFRSRSRPRYHGHEIFRGKSAIVQPWLFFFPPILFSLSLSTLFLLRWKYFHCFFHLFWRRGSRSSILLFSPSFLFLSIIRHDNVEVIIFFNRKQEERN